MNGGYSQNMMQQGDASLMLLASVDEEQQLEFLKEALQARALSLPPAAPVSNSPTAQMMMIPTPKEEEPSDNATDDEDYHMTESAAEYHQSAPTNHRSTAKHNKSVSTKGKKDPAAAKELAQARAREAQRRFREKQKQRREEIEIKLQSLSLEIEQERQLAQTLNEKHLAMENILQIRAQQADILSSAQNEETIPAPIKHALPELVQVMLASSTKGVYSLESLLRFTPANYTAHLGPDGIAKEAPPMSAVIEELRGDIQRVQLALDTASRGSMLSSTPSDAMSTDGETGTNSNDAETENNNTGFMAGSSSGTLVNLDSIHSVTTNAGLTLAAPLDATLSAKNSLVIDVWENTTTATDEKSSEEEEEEEAKPLAKRLGLADMHALTAQLSGVDHLDAGCSFVYNGIRYNLTGDLLKSIGMNMHAIGTVAWQGAVLFPNNSLAMAATRLDTGEKATLAELNNISHWQSVVRRLDLRKDQLESIVRYHKQYLAAVRPVYRERATLVQHLTEYIVEQDGNGVKPIREHISSALRLGECASALTKNVRQEYAAWLTCAGQVFGVMDFPVQRALLFCLSWPYWPQTSTIGSCAAIELGLNPLEYEYDD